MVKPFQLEYFTRNAAYFGGEEVCKEEGNRQGQPVLF